MRSAFGTHSLLQLRTLYGISDQEVGRCLLGFGGGDGWCEAKKNMDGHGMKWLSSSFDAFTCLRMRCVFIALAVMAVARSWILYTVLPKANACERNAGVGCDLP